MDDNISFCCANLKSFIDYWENTNLGVGFGVINPPSHDGFKAFKLCPYCGKEIGKMVIQPQKKFDSEKKYIYEWDDKFSIGIPWIDSQHKKLLDQINILLDSIVKEKKLAECGKIMKFLQNYTMAHFGTEENFMIKHEYPGYKSHKNEHTKFISLIEDLTDEYLEKGATQDFIKKVAKNLWAWYKNHILKSDHAFGEFLKSRKCIYDNESASVVMNQLLDGLDNE
ncbi:MAG: hemerythrin family protein [bacterium]|nr:hemerythrin family protein [bacterium]